jgi:DNA-binding HxlR family transcriptional regulator
MALNERKAKTEARTDSVPPETGCPAGDALDLVASKWAVHIVFQLNRATVLRFRELQRTIGAITQKELTKQLRRLERFGLVSRRIFAEVPLRVEYRLTTLGNTLVDPLVALSRWSLDHASDVASARRKYDADSVRPQPRLV